MLGICMPSCAKRLWMCPPQSLYWCSSTACDYLRRGVFFIKVYVSLFFYRTSRLWIVWLWLSYLFTVLYRYYIIRSIPNVSISHDRENASHLYTKKKGIKDTAAVRSVARNPRSMPVDDIRRICAMKVEAFLHLRSIILNASSMKKTKHHNLSTFTRRIPGPLTVSHVNSFLISMLSAII